MKSNSLIISLLTRIAGVLFYILLLIILSVFSNTLESATLDEIVSFLGKNILLIFFINAVLFISDAFGTLVFPLNLPKGLINAFASILIVSFILRSFELVDILLEEDLYVFMTDVSIFIYPFVFVITLIISYIRIIRKHISKRDTVIYTRAKNGR